ncbi:MAG: hypothetical protein JNL90_01270 [Planctomycetes bacterium]|nr:hypothetical protein [Planctomycetota bacterium]
MSAVDPWRRAARCFAAAAFSLSLALSLASLTACASSEGENAPPPPTPSEQKRMLLAAADRAIHVVLEDARADLKVVLAEFEGVVARAPACYLLASPDPVLGDWGKKKRDERQALLEAASNRTQEQLKLLLAHYEEALWAVAAEGGRRGGGDALGARSGYLELDSKIAASLLQLSREVDVDGVAQSAESAINDHLALERAIRHEMPGVGILSLFKSPPTVGLFGPEDEGVATAVVFSRAKDDPLDASVVGPALAGKPAPVRPAPPGKLSLVQAMRHGIERGGLMVTTTAWRLDPAAQAGGVLPLTDEITAASHVASALCLPAVDKSDPTFRDVWDHVLVAEYRTALRRDDTGELLATIGWQVRWNVDFRGRMRVLVDRDDLVVVDDKVLPTLLAAAPATQ